MEDKYNEILKSAKDLLSNMDTDEFLDKFLRIQDGNKEKDMFVIDIEKDFSQLPQGRYHSDSPNNAEALFILIQDVLDYEGSVELRFNGCNVTKMLINDLIATIQENKKELFSLPDNVPVICKQVLNINIIDKPKQSYDIMLHAYN